MSTVSSPSASPDSSRPPEHSLVASLASSSDVTGSAQANGHVAGYDRSRTSDDIAKTEFRSTRTGGSRRIASDNVEVDTRREHDKKRGRLSGGFLLQPFSRKHRKKQGAGATVDAQGDGSPHQQQWKNGPDGSMDDVEQDQQSALYDRSVGRSSSTEDRLSSSARSRDTKGKSSVASYKSRQSPSTPGSSYSARLREARSSMDTHHGPPAADVDPSQIVRMALSLNEGRRLGLAPGQLPSNGSISSRRVTPSGLALSSPVDANRWQRQQSLSHKPSTPRSAGHSALGSTRLPESLTDEPSRPSSSRPSASISGTPLLSAGFDPDFGHNLSPATLLRAEKARTFFELSHEYRRLLQALPPLKKSGRPAAEEALGREYNPLQYIRNRKVRLRERYPLDSSTAGWDHVEKVQAWVDEVELESKRDGFVAGDATILPHWHKTLRRTDTTLETSADGRASMTPAATDKKVSGQPEWQIDPADLLADAHWLEQDNHKSLIEDRDGHKVYKRFRRTTQGSTAESAYGSSARGAGGLVTDETSPRSNTVASPLTSQPSEASDSDDGLQMGAKGHNSHHSRASRMKRHIFRRRKTLSDEDSSSPDGDDMTTAKDRTHLTKRGMKATNIGPLEKHMKMMLQKESRSNSVDSLQPSAKQHYKTNRRRGGVSDQHAESPEAPSEHRTRKDSNATVSPRSSLAISDASTPRISIEDFEDRTHHPNGSVGNRSRATSETSKSKMKAFPFAFIHKRGGSKAQNHIAENDFAASPPLETIRSQRSLESGHSSLASSRSNSYKDLSQQHSGSYTGQSRGDDDLSLTTTESHREATTRFFKGGRIGELVRTELPRKSDFVWKSKPPRKYSDTAQTPSSRHDMSEDESVISSKLMDRRSSSASDLTGRYRRQALPTFTSYQTHTTDSTSRYGSTDSLQGDHISAQQLAARNRKKSNRSPYDRLRPLSTGGSTDVSPNTSQPDMSRYQDDRSLRPVDSNTRTDSRSPSTSRVRTADRLLNQVLREPGHLSRRYGYPVTGLTSIAARPQDRGGDNTRGKESEDRAGGEHGVEAAMIMQDIINVESRLVATGIRARYLFERANEPPENPSDFLLAASADAKMPIAAVNRREEHVVAARLISATLENTINSFEDDAETFRSKTCRDLQGRIEDLRDKVGSRLTPEVRTCCDDADALIAKLTTTHTLAVKQVNENIELMMRSRWRRVRWFRRTGFTMLEWVVVSFLWVIWLLVALVRVIIGCLRCTKDAVRWLLWM